MAARAALLLVLLSAPVKAQEPDQGQQGLAINSQGERVTIPDPSRIATAQLNAAVAALKEQINAADTAIRQLMEERFTSADRATDLRLKQIDMIPGLVKDSVDHALALIYAKLDQQNEKFASITNRLDDTRRNTEQLAQINAANVDRTSGLIDTAINKAFASAEQARATSENTTKAQIESQGEIQRTNNENSDRLIRDLNDRLTRMESRQIGQGEAKGESQDNTNLLMGLGVLAVGAIGLAFTVSRRQEPVIRYVQAPSPGVTTTTNTQPG